MFALSLSSIIFPTKVPGAYVKVRVLELELPLSIPSKYQVLSFRLIFGTVLVKAILVVVFFFFSFVLSGRDQQHLEVSTPAV